MRNVRFAGRRAGDAFLKSDRSYRKRYTGVGAICAAALCRASPSVPSVVDGERVCSRSAEAMSFSRGSQEIRT